MAVPSTSKTELVRRRRRRPEHWPGAGQLSIDRLLEIGGHQAGQGESPNPLAQAAQTVASGTSKRDHDQNNIIAETFADPGRATRNVAGAVGGFLKRGGEAIGGSAEAGTEPLQTLGDLPIGEQSGLPSATDVIAGPALAGARESLGPDARVRDALGEGARQFFSGTEYLDGFARNITQGRYGLNDLPFYDSTTSPRALRQVIEALSPMTAVMALTGVPALGSRAALGLRTAAANSSSRSANLTLRSLANLADPPVAGASYGNLFAREVAAEVAAQEVGHQLEGIHPALAVPAQFAGAGGAFFGPELLRGAVRGSIRGTQFAQGRVGKDLLSYEYGRPFATMQPHLVDLAAGDTRWLDEDDVAEGGLVIQRLRNSGWAAAEQAEWVAPSGHLVAAERTAASDLLRDGYGVPRGDLDDDAAAETTMLRLGWTRVVGDEVRVWDLDRSVIDSNAGAAIDAIFQERPDATISLRELTTNTLRAFGREDWTARGVSPREVIGDAALSPAIAGGGLDVPEPYDISRYMDEPELGPREARQRGMEGFGQPDRPRTEGPLREDTPLDTPAPESPESATTTGPELDIPGDTDTGRAGQAAAEAERVSTPPEPPDVGSTPTASTTPEQAVAAPLPPPLRPDQKPDAARLMWESGLPQIVPANQFAISERAVNTGFADGPFLIPLEQLTTDPRFQARDQLNQARLSRMSDPETYRPNADAPIEVAIQDGRYVTLDHHRLAAAQLRVQQGWGSPYIVGKVLPELDEAAQAVDAALRNYDRGATNFREDVRAIVRVRDYLEVNDPRATRDEVIDYVTEHSNFSGTDVDTLLTIAPLGDTVVNNVNTSPGRLRPLAYEFGKLMGLVPEPDRAEFAQQAAGAYLSLVNDSAELPAKADLAKALENVRALIEEQGMFNLQAAGMLEGERVNVFGMAIEIARMERRRRLDIKKLTEMERAITSRAEVSGGEGSADVARIKRDLAQEVSTLEGRIENASAEMVRTAQAADAARRAGIDLPDATPETLDNIETNPDWPLPRDERRPEELTPEEAAATSAVLPPDAIEPPSANALTPPPTPDEALALRAARQRHPQDTPDDIRAFLADGEEEVAPLAGLTDDDMPVAAAEPFPELSEEEVARVRADLDEQAMPKGVPDIFVAGSIRSTLTQARIERTLSHLGRFQGREVPASVIPERDAVLDWVSRLTMGITRGADIADVGDPPSRFWAEHVASRLEREASEAGINRPRSAASNAAFTAAANRWARALRDQVGGPPLRPEQTIDELATAQPHLLTGQQRADLGGRPPPEGGPPGPEPPPPDEPPPPSGPGRRSGGEGGGQSQASERLVAELTRLQEDLGAPAGTPWWENPYRSVAQDALDDAYRLGDDGLPDPRTPARLLEGRVNTANRMNRVLVDIGNNMLPDGVGFRDSTGQIHIDPRVTPEVIDFHKALNDQDGVLRGVRRIPEGWEDAYNLAILMRNWEQDFTKMFGDTDLARNYWSRAYRREYLDPAAAAEATGVGGGRFTTPSFQRERSGMSFDKAIATVFADDAGRPYRLHPRYYNPFEQAAHRSRMGFEYRETLKMVETLQSLGQAAKRGTRPPNGWNSTNVSPLLSDFVFPKKVAARLDLVFGDRPSGTIAGRDVLGAYRSINQRAKRAVLFGSLFQHYDLARRSLVATSQGAVEGALSRRLPAHLMDTARLISIATRSMISGSARRDLRRLLLSETPINPRGDISLGDLSSSGLRLAGDPSIRPDDISLGDQWATGREAAVEGLPEEAGVLGKAAGLVRRVGGAVESSLFDVAYPATQVHIARMILPYVDAKYADLPKAQRAAKAADLVNLQMGTLGRADTLIGNAGLYDAADALIFSRAETESQLRMAFEALPFSGSEDANFRRRYLIASFLTTVGLANLVHFAFNGEPLTTERHLPLDYQPGRGFRGVTFRSDFAQPDIPLDSPSGLPLRLDLLVQDDTALRFLNGPQGWIRGRQSVPLGHAFDQLRGEDFFGNPLDSPAQRLGAVATSSAPISAQHGIQIARLQGFNPGGAIPEGESSLGVAGLIAQSLGPNLSAPGSLEILNDAAIGRFKAPYEDLTRIQKQEVQRTLPPKAQRELQRKAESSAERGSEGAQRTQNVEQLTQRRDGRLTEVVRRYHSADPQENLSGAAARLRIADIKRDYANQLKGIDTVYAEYLAGRGEAANPLDRALFGWYDLYEAAEDATGEMDYDHLDELQGKYLDNLSEEERDYISQAEQAGIENPALSAFERRIKETQRDLARTGYWDVNENAWGEAVYMLEQSDPGNPLIALAKQDGQREFRRGLELTYRQQLAEEGYGPGVAENLAAMLTDRHPVMQVFSRVRTIARLEWIQQYPEMAEHALELGYLRNIGLRGQALITGGTQ